MNENNRRYGYVTDIISESQYYNIVILKKKHDFKDIAT